MIWWLLGLYILVLLIFVPLWTRTLNAVQPHHPSEDEP